MPVTITAGITFNGGLDIAFGPPPPSPALPSTAGWFIGGGPSRVSTIARITYATDTATASDRGPLPAPLMANSAAGNNTNGWIVGGWVQGAYTSAIQRITYATDTATATVRATLSEPWFALSSVTDNQYYGWFCGGRSYNFYICSTVQRVDYAVDTTTPSVRGPLSASKAYTAGSGTSTYGWLAAGDNAGGGFGITSLVTRITYASDTNTSTTRGPLSISAYYVIGTGNNNYGYFGSGSITQYPYTPISALSRITYANDTATASTRGPLSLARYLAIASTDNTTYGWVGGGVLAGPGTSTVSTVDRIDYTNDTATASVRGPITQSVSNLGATSGVQ